MPIKKIPKKEVKKEVKKIVNVLPSIVNLGAEEKKAESNQKVVNISFQVGDNVVYPAHGVGEIVSIEDTEVLNMSFPSYVIYFFKDKIKCLIPASRVKGDGLRKICSEEVANKVFEILSRPCKVNRGTWGKRVQEYEMKMQSGSVLLIAEMVRSLFNGVGDPNRSYGERVIYENAFHRVASEISVCLKKDMTFIEEKMILIMSDAKEKSGAKILNVANANKDDFGDFDEDVASPVAKEG